MYPRIVTDLQKLKHNIDRTVALCHGAGCAAALVTKCVCADARVAAVLEKSGADYIADSRVQNLASLKTEKPRYLLRAAQPCETRDVIAHSEVSQESEISTVRLLGAEAKRQMRRHRIVVMIDMGDLREGVFYKNREELLALAKAVADEDMLELYGVGVNLTCFGGILPDEMNLGGLAQIAAWLRAETGLPIPLVSGGNSSTLPMLLSGTPPAGINHLRIGEGYLLGNETASGTLMPGFYPDCFTLEAQLIEVKRKPSKPIGTSGPNAFGEYVSFEDKGEMLRGICAVGRQDVAPDGLAPLDPNVAILGASSDHLLLDLTGAGGRYMAGDILGFTPDYGALLRAFTGAYVEKTYTGANN
ncbi:MAG TPA: alanine/ornithine racemase family PLP-dependent enzyme [Clostridia bacterium]|nr:alanine/ornithine racemase family PLP-dependent enzyme [Clostridia bacterium]